MGLVITETVVLEAVFHGFVAAEDIRDWLASVDRVIERGQAFYFIASTLENATFDEAYRAIQAHWYKANREHFVDHVVDALKARRGGILLMHEIHPHTLAQLETLIQRLQAEGFHFVALDDPALAASLR